MLKGEQERSDCGGTGQSQADMEGVLGLKDGEPVEKKKDGEGEGGQDRDGDCDQVELAKALDKGAQ